MREIETGSLPPLLTENRLCFASELTENKLIYGVEKETTGRLGHVAVAVAVAVAVIYVLGTKKQMVKLKKSALADVFETFQHASCP